MEFTDVPKSDARWVAHEAGVSINEARAALVIADGSNARAIEIAKSNGDPSEVSATDAIWVSHNTDASLELAKALIATTDGNLDLAKDIVNKDSGDKGNTRKTSKNETKSIQDSSTSSEEDVEIVANRVGVPKKDARWALSQVDDVDLAAAISLLESRENSGGPTERSSDTEIYDPE